MNEAIITPESLSQLHAVIADSDCVLPVGNRSKPTLSQSAAATLVSTRALQGVIQYDPAEFTFTAHAGTTLATLVAILAERHQYLPFDPLLVAAGATLGGTVAAGLSGPGRFRFGGLRDFILGVEFLSGDGHTIRAGGKVVKNAAGFDIPKLLVGSLGRLGILTRITMKAFPKPVARQTLVVGCESHGQALERIAIAARSRWELDAIDYVPSSRQLWLRVAGPATSNAAIATDIRATWGSDAGDHESAEQTWINLCELKCDTFAAPHQTIKLPTTPTSFLNFAEALAMDSQLAMHLSVAANLLWLWTENEAASNRIAEYLTKTSQCGLIVRGNSNGPLIGTQAASEMRKRVKFAMDPLGKFPLDVI